MTQSFLLETECKDTKDNLILEEKEKEKKVIFMHHCFLSLFYNTELTKEANGTARLYVISCGLRERRKLGGSLVAFHFQIFAKRNCKAPNSELCATGKENQSV